MDQPKTPKPSLPKTPPTPTPQPTSPTPPSDSNAPQVPSRQKNHLKLIGGLFIIALLALAWWAWKNIFNESTPAIPSKITPITINLKWLHQTQFAGHYVADQKGYYRDIGLEVSLIPFDYNNLPINEVVSGNADYGVTGADEILVARAEGKPVVALAVIYQENPVTAYSLSDSNITKPTDFIGKKVGVQEGINVEFMVKAMLAKQGVDYDEDITVVPIGFDEKEIVSGEVDVATGYVTNEPIQAENAGYAVNIIHPKDYGVNVYADVLFTTEDTAKNKPELTKAFVQATLKGWEYALQNQDEAVELTLRYEDPNNDSLNFEHQQKLLQRSVPLIKPTPGTKIGQMDYSRWLQTFRLLKEHNIIDQDIDVTSAYVTDFIK